ncbi:MAG TPA: hypothetical protein VM115_03430 [Vicinamibacterales bacterium]|nr:hypothetical protein [Vicinamibacterales bacterium]
MKSMEEVRAITPRRPGHKRPSCVKRFHETWIVRVITQRCAQPLDRRIQTVLEINKRPGRPQALPQLFARYDVAGAFEHHRQNFEWLILKTNADAPLRSARAGRLRTSQIA